jgi:nucleoside-triphosphatase THEP1
MDTLCGNTINYNNICTWIEKNHESNQDTLTKISYEDCLFVYGKSGIGKTYSINKICELLDLFVIYISSSNCSSSAELLDLITKASSSSLIQVLKNTNKRKIIIIDEFESIMTLDRNVNISLCNILANKKIKKIPIICICSYDIKKKLGTIKKKCKSIDLSEPTPNDIYIYLKNNYENISEDNLKAISELSNGKISQAISKITNINDNILECTTIDRVNTLEYLYSSVNDNNTFNINEIYKILITQYWVIPLQFHENLIIELKNRKGTIKEKSQFYLFFIKNFIYYDIFLSANVEVACMYLSNIIYQLFEIKKKKGKLSKIDNFSKILSYLSLQKKFIKKNYNSKYPLYQLGNYHINITGRNFIFFN